MCLAQGPQRSDVSEARTRGLSVLSQALYHWAIALPTTCFGWEIRLEMCPWDTDAPAIAKFA